MSSTLQEILNRIHSLSESEQLQLRSELAREDENEWASVAKEARTEAARRGIDDEQITAAVESFRYRNGRAE